MSTNDKKVAEVRELKADKERLEKLNRKLKRDAKAIATAPNIVQLAVTGTCVVTGVGGGIAGHRLLRRRTQTWRKSIDPNNEPAKAALEAYKAGTATPEQLEMVQKNTKRTLPAVLVCEALPIALGLVTGAATAMSDNGVVASAGGLGWGVAGGTLLDLAFPGPPPPPPKAKT